MVYSPQELRRMCVIIASVAKYIHELEEWPSYRYDPVALLSSLEQVNLKRGRLFGVLEASKMLRR